jgi:hypothetical protein
MKRRHIFGLLALALAVGLLPGFGVQATQAQALPFHHGNKAALQTVTVPAGTPIAIRMQSSVSSKTASAGQHFQATLDDPLIVEGKTVAPRGADVSGHVVAARSSGRLHKPGYLRLTLDSVVLNGKRTPLETSSIFLEASSHKKRNAVLIGGGTGAGALIGGLVGGPKGALIGAGVGAGAGTGTAYATGKKEVGVGVERRLTFRLRQPLTTQG